MLTPRHIFFSAALLLLMASLWVYAATWSPSYENCQADYAVKKATESQPAITPGVSERLGGLVVCESVVANENGAAIAALATLIMALFTGTLWWATTEQGRLTRVSIDLSRETAKRELRAYISVMPMRASLSLDDRTVHVLADSENTGRTPSFQTQVLWDVSVMEYPLTVRLRYEGHIGDLTKPVPTFVLYPGQKSMTVKPYKLSDEQITNIRAKTHALYAYGRVTYLAAFNDPQWAEFCAYIDGDLFDIWCTEAQKSPNRQPVAAPFKFTQNNNTASF